MKVQVFKIPQNSPDDLFYFDQLVRSKQLDVSKIVAILGKTEGNGCVNDFTRGFAIQTLKSYIGLQTSKAEEIVYVMSGGTEGVLSPHLTVFTRQPSRPEEPQRLSLAVGVSRTRDFLPDEIGTLTMVKTVAAAVTEAIADLFAPEHVHFVQIKCPLVKVVSRHSAAQDSYKSMAYSRGAAALGVAVAVGELALEELSADDICSNYSLYSAVASTSAGSELKNCEIMVLGNSPQATSDYIIGHSVMQHALDVGAVQTAIAQTGQLPHQIVNLFAKAEAATSGYILNRRHTMLDDSDINHTRMARAVVGAVVSSVVQEPMVYVSGGSEHQGPSGGGPIAAIARFPG